jgi:DNA topoisomerase 2-associated protein PAT1
LTTKEALKILENLYDIVLDIEQLRREQSNLDTEDTEAVNIWYVVTIPFFYFKKSLSVFIRPAERNARYSELVQQLWDDLKVMVPLETRYTLAGHLSVASLTRFFFQQPTPIHLPDCPF